MNVEVSSSPLDLFHAHHVTTIWARGNLRRGPPTCRHPLLSHTARYAVSSSNAPLPRRDSTFGLIGSTADLIEGKSSDIDGWLAAASTWNVDAKNLYSPKKQGRSFLMTTKLVAYIKNSLATLDAGFDAANPPYSVEKTKEWLTYAEGFTAGTLQGDEARSAFARATWGNYDKSDKLNRIGLCAFGETAGTKALGVNCDGY